MDQEVQIVQDMEALSKEGARQFAAWAREAVAARGRFAAALSGGGTPLGMYGRLAEPPYHDEVPWSAVHLFWSDERAVPAEDPESNYGQARRALVGRVPIPVGNVHRVPGELGPEAAAEAYEAEVRAFFGGRPEFDVVLLGMGNDGHVAALFPGSAALEERERAVAATTGDYRGRPALRVTLTLPAIEAARRVMVLVSGEEKAATLRAALKGPFAGLPAQRIGGQNVTWLVDEAAARDLDRG